MFRISFSNETESTNDDAAKLLGRDDSAGLVLVTDFQRSGRGRRERRWIAPPGSSLLFTAILPRPLSTSSLWALPFWTALGVAEGIEAATGLRAALQWPNDLLLGGRKCCGILCISRVNGERAWAACGVGCNILRPADESLGAIEPAPAFLSDEAPGVERGPVLKAILAAFARASDDVDRPDDVARRWEQRAELAGTSYRLLPEGGTPFTATAKRLGPEGELVVEDDGDERVVALADVRVLR